MGNNAVLGNCGGYRSTNWQWSQQNVSNHTCSKTVVFCTEACLARCLIQVALAGCLVQWPENRKTVGTWKHGATLEGNKETRIPNRWELNWFKGGKFCHFFQYREDVCQSSLQWTFHWLMWTKAVYLTRPIWLSKGRFIHFAGCWHQ